MIEFLQIFGFFAAIIGAWSVIPLVLAFARESQNARASIPPVRPMLELVAQATDDPIAARRAEAIEVMRDHYPEALAPMLSVLRNDPSPSVCLAVAAAS